MRLVLGSLALAAVSATLLACGGSSSDKQQQPEDNTANPPAALSSAQVAGFRTRAEKFAESMSSVSTAAQKCGQGATSSKAITSCLADALTNAEGQMDSIISYTDDLADSVSGQCRVQLQAFSTTMTAARDGFAKAADDAKSNNLNALKTDLSAIDAKAITAAGKKVDQACQGAVSAP